MISLIRQDSNRFTDGFPIALYKRQGAIIHSFPLEVGGVRTHIITEFGVEFTPNGQREEHWLLPDSSESGLRKRWPEIRGPIWGPGNPVTFVEFDSLIRRQSLLRRLRRPRLPRLLRRGIARSRHTYRTRHCHHPCHQRCGR